MTELTENTPDTPKRQEKTRKNNVGVVVDKFYKLAANNRHFIHIDPSAMPNPHEHYLALGQEVIRVCDTEGATFDRKIKSEADIKAWKRLLGVWVCYTRRVAEKQGDVPPRSEIADQMGVSPSSLTNFLNARRPITLKALRVMADKMGVKVLDIRPEMGASDLYSRERKIKKTVQTVKTHLGDVIDDLERDEAKNAKMTVLLGKLVELRGLLD